MSLKFLKHFYSIKFLKHSLIIVESAACIIMYSVPEEETQDLFNTDSNDEAIFIIMIGTGETV